LIDLVSVELRYTTSFLERHAPGGELFGDDFVNLNIFNHGTFQLEADIYFLLILGIFFPFDVDGIINVFLDGVDDIFFSPFTPSTGGSSRFAEFHISPLFTVFGISASAMFSLDTVSSSGLFEIANIIIGTSSIIASIIVPCVN